MKAAENRRCTPSRVSLCRCVSPWTELAVDADSLFSGVLPSADRFDQRKSSSRTWPFPQDLDDGHGGTVGSACVRRARVRPAASSTLWAARPRTAFWRRRAGRAGRCSAAHGRYADGVRQLAERRGRGTRVAIMTVGPAVTEPTGAFPRKRGSWCNHPGVRQNEHYRIGHKEW